MRSAINSLHAGYFLCFGVVCWLFSKLALKNSLNEHYKSFKRFASRTGPTFCRSWSGFKLFAKVISRRTKFASCKERVKTQGLVIGQLNGNFVILSQFRFDMNLCSFTLVVITEYWAAFPRISPIHTMKLLSATFVCIILYCTDDETFVCNFTLPVAFSPAKIMHYAPMYLLSKASLILSTGSPSSPSKAFHRHSSCCHIALLTFLCL